MLLAYIWGPDSKTNVYSDWFLILTKMLPIWFLGFTAICCQFTTYYLVPMYYWGIFAGLCLKLSSDSLLKKTGYRASEAYPLMLEAFAVAYWRMQSTLHGESCTYRTEEDRWILPWKLLWYLAREKWVAYTRNFLLWYADRFPHIHTILIFLMLISCMKWGFAGLFSFLSICHIFACFQVHRVPKSSSTEN